MNETITMTSREPQGAQLLARLLMGDVRTAAAALQPALAERIVGLARTAK